MQGTVFWMAPEVVKTNKKGYTFKIDIWSIGCIVLEMWAGRRPWNDEESVSVMYKVRISIDPLLLTLEYLRRRFSAVSPRSNSTGPDRCGTYAGCRRF